jgi:hypothetical protein
MPRSASCPNGERHLRQVGLGIEIVAADGDDFLAVSLGQVPTMVTSLR